MYYLELDRFVDETDIELNKIESKFKHLLDKADKEPIKTERTKQVNDAVKQYYTELRNYYISISDKVESFLTDGHVFQEWSYHKIQYTNKMYKLIYWPYSIPEILIEKVKFLKQIRDKAFTNIDYLNIYKHSNNLGQ